MIDSLLRETTNLRETTRRRASNDGDEIANRFDDIRDSPLASIMTDHWRKQVVVVISVDNIELPK
jgi:hypothetical protein